MFRISKPETVVEKTYNFITSTVRKLMASDSDEDEEAAYDRVDDLVSQVKMKNHPRKQLVVVFGAKFDFVVFDSEYDDKVSEIN